MAAGCGRCPRDGGGQLRRVGRIALVHGVVEHHPVGVVEDLGLVAELDRAAQPSLGDRPGVAVVQADPAGRAVGDDPGDPLAGLRGDSAGGVQQLREVVDRAPQPAPAAPRVRVPAAGRGKDAEFFRAK